MKTGDEHSLRLMRVAVVLAGVLPLLFLAAAAWTSYGASIAAAEASLDELAVRRFDPAKQSVHAPQQRA